MGAISPTSLCFALLQAHAVSLTCHQREFSNSIAEYYYYSATHVSSKKALLISNGTGERSFNIGPNSSLPEDLQE